MDEELRVVPTIATTASIIKIIGVGGGGGNAVGQMYTEGIPDVRFLVCNTDSKALEDAVVPDKLQLGPGLGAGGRPEIGREYAEENLDKIDRIFDKDVKMVFITAGMGGGTGTGASPVIAREARKRGILTIGVVTIPFIFERERQIDKALNGLDLLSKEVDALLVINNQRLLDIHANISVIDAFKKADETLTNAVRSIVEIISMHGKVNLDFRDVNNVLRNGGVAIMSSGEGEGDCRVTKAIENALYSPLVNNNDIYRSRRLIISITTSSDPAYTLRMEEFREIEDFTSRFHCDIETKWGLVADDSMGKRIKITLLASGFNLYAGKEEKQSTAERVQDDYEREKRRRNYYTEMEKGKDGKKKRLRRHPRIFLYSLDNLDNEQLTAAIEETPTARRSYEDLSALFAMSVHDGPQAETAPAHDSQDGETTRTIRFDS